MATPQEPNAPKNEDLMFTAHHPMLRVPPPPARPLSYWVKKVLVCNPFFLVSAALLLYGFYLVANDANFPGKEIAQLTFNFTSMQAYELLLVGTAILLARRRIHYDSNLLIFLENGLILVPLILISQAALVIPHVVPTLCVIGGVMALVRFGGLKRLHTSLNLPRGLLVSGVVLLVVNVALPLIFRHLHETKLGTKPTDGTAFYMNQYSWFLILPAIIGLANCLPRPAQAGELLPQRRWIPTSLFALWIAGSAVHLHCLGYVYNFDWEAPFAIPAVWVLAWTIYNRQGDFVRVRGLSPALLLPPAFITLVAALNSVPRMFLALTCLNIFAYAFLLLKNRSNRMALHLLVFSLAALALGLVGRFANYLPAEFNVGNCAPAFITAYIGFWVGVSRSPKLAIAGAIAVGIGTGTLFGPHFEGPHLGIQCGLLFLILHSLLWRDEAHPGARGARIFACSLWMMHSLLLVPMKWPHGEVALFAGAALVLLACVMARLLRGQWPPIVLPMAAGMVSLLHPGNYFLIGIQSTPIGLWVVAGSFLLFALGTYLALSRSKWSPVDPTIPAATETNPTHQPL
jgi:hypothetical protein